MWIDSLDLAIDTVNTATDAQDCAMAFTINDPESISWNILSGQVGLYVATHGQNIGGSFYPPMYRTWPQGYMCGGIPTLGVSGFTGFARFICGSILVRINRRKPLPSPPPLARSGYSSRGGMVAGFGHAAWNCYHALAEGDGYTGVAATSEFVD